MCALSIVEDDRLASALEEIPHADVQESRPRLIKTEANLLRLPLFALHTKGLKTLDGIECSGRVHRDGQTHQFTFRATRNTATLYPGPLARSAHLAFLSILTDQGLPSEDPITWTWRDLCRRMRVTYGGQMVRHLKVAITSTAALFLQSEHALYSKPDGKLLSTQQDALHLYDRVTFVGAPLPEGGMADRNYLWFSEWYRKNLNAMFTAPLDYDLWRYLDEQSPIASRLYEFLLLNFYSQIPVLRINYKSLVQFLPIHPERYRSSADRQLQGAFQLLMANRVIAKADWAPAKEGIGQLHLYRGDRLPLSGNPGSVALPFMDEELTSAALEVKELRNIKPPEWTLVSDFYRLWTGDTRHRPTPKEMDQAGGLITEHGPAKAKNLISHLVKRLKVDWPDAKTFGATAKYLPEALRDVERTEHRQEQEKRDREAEEVERRNLAQQTKDRTAWKVLWDRLPEVERQEIRNRVLAQQPPKLAKFPSLLERFCLDELARLRPSGLQP